jgi:hypothetical protein
METVSAVTNRYQPTPRAMSRDIRELLHLLWRALSYLDSIGNHRTTDQNGT